MDPYDDMGDRETVLPDLAFEAYERKPKSNVDGQELIRETDTTKFQKKGDTIVVAVRGTEVSSKEDMKANASIAFNKVKDTKRFKKDKAAVESVQQMQSPKEQKQVGVGHSLGGAVVDNLIGEGLVRKGVSFNPAIEPKQIRKGKHERIQNPDDPLQKIEGRFAKNARVVSKPRESLAEIVTQPIPQVGKIVKGLKAHELSQFKKRK